MNEKLDLVCNIQLSYLILNGLIVDSFATYCDLETQANLN